MGHDLPSIVFMGTPEFALPSLEALLAAGVPVLLVVTQPDRPKGRGRKVVASPVKQLALQRGLQVFQPEKIRKPDAIERIRAESPECIVVVAYGQLLPASLLEVPPLGAVNVHASLLPGYRGAAPVHWALIKGETVTGVTTILMDEGMDTGEILLQRAVAIRAEETVGTLHDRLAAEGASLLVETLGLLRSGGLEPTAQDGSQASYAPTLTREDGRVNWDDEPGRICCRIRGLDPWPGAFTRWQGKRLKLFGCQPLVRGTRSRPGTVVAVAEEGLKVAAREGMVIVERVQLEGGRALSVRDFLRGHSLQVGTVLGE
jgi:methionyl-tRNA formyltransferase